MSYCSPYYFLILLPIAILLYGITPKKYKSKTLLVLSYIFFWMISNKLIIYLLISTFSIHHFGIWLNKIKNERDIQLQQVEKEEKKEIKNLYKKKEKRVLLLAVILHIGCLLVVKYTPFFLENVNSLLKVFNSIYQFEIPKFLIPIGISFYTLQAVSYMADVYNDKIKADDNLGRLALYMAFFPQIMEGPIARYSDTAESLWEGRPITYKNLTFGFQRILWGLLKKMVIADRLNSAIKEVFGNYTQYDGGTILLVAVFYTIQLYMEFSGTMDVVIGSGEIFGIKLPENFKQPFLSKSINEFWHRWHITLGTWFKDYIFYPVSLSKPMKKLTTFGRKHLGNHLGPLLAGAVALFCVWSCNGIWHGAAWSFIFYGMYHFIMILFENIFEPYVGNLCKKIHINRLSWPYKSFQIFKTFWLIVIGELFFRADTLNIGMKMFGRIFSNFSIKGLFGAKIHSLGLNISDVIIVIITLVIVFTINILREKEVNIREKVASRPIVLRWTIYYILMLYVIIFGAYGGQYIPIDPIYANFSGVQNETIY